jgi:hypothetical protein
MRHQAYAHWATRLAEVGHEVRWVTAARRIAGHLAFWLNRPRLLRVFVRLSRPQRAFLVQANELIYLNVVPRLQALETTPPLRGLAAFEWDARLLAEEQQLMQPLYERLPADNGGLAQMQRLLSTPPLWLRVLWLPNTQLRLQGSLLRVQDRWQFGMQLLYPEIPAASMPCDLPCQADRYRNLYLQLGIDKHLA